MKRDAAAEIEPREPQFEIGHCRIVPAAQATACVRDPDPAATLISLRALAEAFLV